MNAGRLRDLLSETLGLRERAAPPVPPDEGVATLAPVLEALAATDFLGERPLVAYDRFHLLALSLDAAIGRDCGAMARIEAIEATPRAHGRSHGLEWGYEQLFVDVDRLRQVADLLRKLAPHEREVRALLVRGEIPA